ncbi:MAG: hypothetical protein JWP78_2768 [Mucilaginibacter sp.]|nr:hypothetical protein [Mucilaginibacter sp.]
MTEVDLKFKILRVNLRRHGLNIAEDVFKRHHHTTKPKDEICVFCNSITAITKEHVLPKWILENNLQETMTSSVNKQMITYNKALVPACSECNNSILAFIEKYIIKVIQYMDALDNCSNEDACNIIRWLEIIDYKLQVLDCRRKYIKYGNSEYDRDWGRFSVSMMRHFLSMSPWRAYDWLRSSQRRIIVKEKIKGVNSLIILKPRIPHFYFFTQPNEYIYLSFPMCKIAVFYFFKRRYEYYEDAAAEALDIIKKVAESG